MDDRPVESTVGFVVIDKEGYIWVWRPQTPWDWIKSLLGLRHREAPYCIGMVPPDSVKVSVPEVAPGIFLLGRETKNG